MSSSGIWVYGFFESLALREVNYNKENVQFKGFFEIKNLSVFEAGQIVSK